MPQPQNGQRQQALAELAARSRVQEARQRAKALCMSRPLGLDRGQEVGELRSGEAYCGAGSALRIFSSLPDRIILVLRTKSNESQGTPAQVFRVGTLVQFL